MSHQEVVSPNGGEKMDEDNAILLCERIFAILFLIEMDAIKDENIYKDIKELLVGVHFSTQM